MGYPMVMIQVSSLKSGQPLYSGWSQCDLRMEISLHSCLRAQEYACVE